MLTATTHGCQSNEQKQKRPLLNGMKPKARAA